MTRSHGGLPSVALRNWRPALIGALLAVAAAHPVWGNEGDPPANFPAIPPGQETLMLEMLSTGAPLADGCTLVEGKIEFTVVEARYSCRSGDVVLEIAHASQAYSRDTQTEQFAITVMEGSPLPDLVDELSARIVQRESDFEWVMPADEDGDAH